MADQSPPALAAAVQILSVKAPSLDGVFRILEEAHDYKWFCGLVGEVFPEDSAGILGRRDWVDQMTLFLKRVDEVYLPMPEYYLEYHLYEVCADGESIFACLRHSGIPMDLQGVSWEDLHELWDQCGPGLGALCLLVETPPDPYGGLRAPGQERSDDGLRVAWMAEAAIHIPEATLMRIPEGGVPLGRLVRAMAGTPFEGLAFAGAWLHSAAGNPYVDVSRDEHMESGIMEPWDQERLAIFSEWWREAEPLLSGMWRTASWLQEDLPVRFAEVLGYLLDRLEAFPAAPAEDGEDEVDQPLVYALGLAKRDELINEEEQDDE